MYFSKSIVRIRVHTYVRFLCHHAIITKIFMMFLFHVFDLRYINPDLTVPLSLFSSETPLYHCYMQVTWRTL